MAEVGTYRLHVPEQNDLANVPKDINTLVTGLTTALDGKLDETPAITDVSKLQTKISIVTSPPTSVGTHVEGDVIFVVA